MNAIDGSDTIQISLNGVRVGTLNRLVNDTIVFAFDPDYEADLQRPILSLCYKGALNVLVPDKIRSAGRLPPFFSNLLPEGHLRDYLCLKHGIKPHREFHLLSVLGRDLPGAVVAEPVGRFVEILDDASAPASKPATLRFSLAGIQLKFSAITEATGTFTIPANGEGGSGSSSCPARDTRKFLKLNSQCSSLRSLWELKSRNSGWSRQTPSMDCLGSLVRSRRTVLL